MATIIEELAISLGLDLTQFERDYATASRQVQQAASKLTQETRMSKLRMEIDMSRFDAAQNSVKAFSTKITHLNTILNQQRNVVALANRAHEESVRQYGANSAAARRLEERLLREQRAQADLERQIRQTQEARDQASNAKWVKVGEAASQAADAAGAAMAALAVISVKAAVDAVESENLFEEAFGSMADTARAWSKDLRQELGLNEGAVRKQAATFYVMFNSMGLATPQAYELSTGLTKLAYDMASFYNLDTDSAFEKLKSGITGEMEPLKALGILVDEDTVKRTAWANGIAEQGAELTNQQKVLARYTSIMEQTSKAQGDLARTADSPANQMRRLKNEAEALEVELGKKLLPVLQELMGGLTNVVDGFNGMNKASQDGVLELVKVGAEIGIVNTGLTGMAWALGLPLPPWAKLAVAIGIATVELNNYTKAQKEAKEADESRALIGAKPSKEVAKVRRNEDGTWEKETDELDTIGTAGPFDPAITVKKWAKITGDELAGVEEQARKTKEALDSGMSLDDFEKQAANKAKLEEEARKTQEKAAKQAQTDAEAAAKKSQELTNETYKLTHNALEAELKDIDTKAQKYREQKMDEVTITEWAEAAKADAIKKFNDSTMAEIDASFKTELQSRLDGIEREKQAYIQKGVEEIKANRWAEEEKAKTLREAAKQAITTQKEYLDIVKNMYSSDFSATETRTGADGKSGGKIITVNQAKTDAERQALAVQQIVEKMRKKLGIDSNYIVTPALMGQFSQIMKIAEANLIPGMENMGENAGSQFGNGFAKIDIISGTTQQIAMVKEQVGTLTERFAQVGQESSNRFFAPFHEQLTNLVSNIDTTSRQVSVVRGTAASNVTVSPTININNPIVQDSQQIAEIADQVADIIQPAVINAIGGNGNGY